MGYNFSLKFACEIDPNVRRLLMKLHRHEKVFDDCTSKDFMKHATHVDLFMNGFPCQPFSNAGANQGVLDPRGTIVFSTIQWIRKHKPTTFLLENVRGLVSQHSETFAAILTLLSELKDGSGVLYNVSWQVLNLRKHGGVPQNRERVFIAGILKSGQKSPMSWPGEARLLLFVCLSSGLNEP